MRRGGGEGKAQRVVLGRLEYDLGSREPVIGGSALSLPRRELAVLDALVRRSGRVVMREQLESQVYGYENEISSNAEVW